MKKLTSLTIALGAVFMLGACSGAKEETAVFHQEMPSELQGKNLGGSDLKITHKGDKVTDIVAETAIPLTFGMSAEDVAAAKKEIEDNPDISQAEKDSLLAEMEKTSTVNPEEQAAEMAKNLDDVYEKMSSKGITIKTKKDKELYHVTLTVDLEKADKSKLAETILPIDFSKTKTYQDVTKELKKLEYQEKK